MSKDSDFSHVTVVITWSERNGNHSPRSIEDSGAHLVRRIRRTSTKLRIQYEVSVASPIKSNTVDTACERSREIAIEVFSSANGTKFGEAKIPAAIRRRPIVRVLRCRVGCRMSKERPKNATMPKTASAYHALGGMKRRVGTDRYATMTRQIIATTFHHEPSDPSLPLKSRGICGCRIALRFLSRRTAAICGRRGFNFDRSNSPDQRAPGVWHPFVKSDHAISCH